MDTKRGDTMSNQGPTLQDRILDKALEQAEASSWERLRLHAVAETLNITLDEIRQYFPQKDDLVEAWFDRADRALLSAAHSKDFLDLPLCLLLEVALSVAAMEFFDSARVTFFDRVLRAVSVRSTFCDFHPIPELDPDPRFLQKSLKIVH